jgi:RHS repeat-associated protein
MTTFMQKQSPAATASRPQTRQQRASHASTFPAAHIYTATATQAATYSLTAVYAQTHNGDPSGVISGYRYYNPELGRWVNRDPIGEQGGVNLFGFVRNRTTFRIDRLGLSELTPTSARALCNEIRQQTDDSPRWVRPIDDDDDMAACNAAVAAALAQPEVQEVWNQFWGPDCAEPQRTCMCCSEGLGGRYNQSANEIRICWNNVESSSNPGAQLSTILRHEAIHALQRCTGQTHGGGCTGSLRRELQAYRCAGQCEGYSECLDRALRSSCGTHCSSNMHMAQVAGTFHVNRQWFEEMEADLAAFCSLNPIPAEPAEPSTPGAP